MTVEDRHGLTRLQRLWVALAALALVFSRRPDALFHPRFYAEDGAVWFAQAYNHGWQRALLLTDGGYFQTLSRLSAALSLLVPLAFAPLVLNLVAFVVPVLGAVFLLSSRLHSLAPLRVRALMAFLYLALPNTREVNSILTYAQWHLALLACLLLLADEPRGRWQRAVEFTAVLLAGLSGPFCLMLLPPGAIFWWRRRGAFRGKLILVLAAAGLLQLVTIVLQSPATRVQTLLGASMGGLLKILGGQIYLGALIGPNLLATDNGEAGILLALIAALGTAMVLYCWVSAELEWRVLLLFCGLVFAASLISPMTSGPRPRWQVLRESPEIRYWFFPMLGFGWSLIWCLTIGRYRTTRDAALIALAIMLIGICRNWRYPSNGDFDFARYVAEFQRAPAGTAIAIPIAPGGAWSVNLVRK